MRLLLLAALALHLAFCVAHDMAVAPLFTSPASCPVCGMPAVISSHFDFNGHQSIYFCSMVEHREVFAANPMKFWSSSSASSTKPASSNLLTGADSGASSAMPTAKTGKQCPVCLMNVPVDGDPHVDVKGNQAIHACSTAHAELFSQAPLRYAGSNPGGGSSNMPPASSGVGTSSTDSGDGTHTDVGAFCIGESVMGNGFSFNPDACVLYLFKGWVLDNRMKLAFAVVGTFFGAILYEFLAWYRVRVQMLKTPEARLIDREISNRHLKKRMLGLYTSLLYGVGVVLAYWLMLLAMTYHAGLFVAVIVGLTVGHHIFRFELDSPYNIVEEPDHCCA
mmetsp:Transcript_4961/g.12334  ORF Transcript_4961/g.12334 Transcript_4961/m.12334 type:complete len:335 (-) Transcript_4961:265-1269(-)